MLLAQRRESAGAADVFYSREQPERKQNLRVGGRSPRPVQHSPDSPVEGRKIERLEKLPDRPRRMLFAHHRFQVARHPLHLASNRTTQARLLRPRRASLAKWNLGHGE